MAVAARSSGADGGVAPDMTPAQRSGTIDIADLGSMYRLGFGAMRITGPGIC